MFSVSFKRESLLQAAAKKGISGNDIVDKCKITPRTFRKVANEKFVSTKTAGKILKLLPDVEIFTPTAQRRSDESCRMEMPNMYH